MKTFEVLTSRSDTPLRIEGGSFDVSPQGLLSIYESVELVRNLPPEANSSVLETHRMTLRTVFVAAPGQWGYVRELKTQRATA